MGILFTENLLWFMQIKWYVLITSSQCYFDNYICLWMFSLCLIMLWNALMMSMCFEIWFENDLWIWWHDYEVKFWDMFSWVLWGVEISWCVGNMYVKNMMLLNMKVRKHEAWACIYLCNDCGAKVVSNVKVKVKGAGVVS